jgi:hypothetical protein
LIALDANSFALLVHPDAAAPIDPGTGKIVVDAAGRYRRLQDDLQRANETILIPTPALAEVLVGLEDEAPTVLDRIMKSARFKIADFDIMAAVELAGMTREALRAGDKKAGSPATWQKVKIDRQIIAIARCRSARAIYSDDEGIEAFAKKIGMPVIKTWNLPLPEIEHEQISLFNMPEDDQG